MKLGWVDFSREARKRAVEALDALEEKGAVDELGVGVLRDAFADRLFPEKAGNAMGVGSGWLDYRLGNAMRILRDMVGQRTGETPALGREPDE